MRVKLYPADRGGCGYHRIIWPAEALRAQGADVDIVFHTDAAERQINAAYWNGDDGTRTLLSVEAPDCDVVVMQRPLTDVLADAIPMLQARGTKVVVEIDDDFTSISPRNISFHAVHPKRDPRRNSGHLKRACETADLVVCSTPALAGVYGRHGRVVVVPNFVPESYQWIPRPWHDGTVIGWSGSIETHPDDLQVMGRAMANTLRVTDARFQVVGTGNGIRKALGLNEQPLACGWQPIDTYPSMMADFDIGVVPLERSRFNEAKSALKMMEMSAVGVAAVGSPTAENVRMVAEGVGMLADHPKEWERLLRRLVESPAEREEVAGSSREAMQRFTIEGNCGRFWDAWSSAARVRQAA